MDRFQIRTPAHEVGEMWISRNTEGHILLETEDSMINLGSSRDALLVAKCIEVSTKWDTSDEFAEASRAALQETLEQVKANHELIDPQNHE